MKNIRAQKKLLKALRDKNLISKQVYHLLYNRAKGGFFRTRRHIKLYIEERKLIKKEVISSQIKELGDFVYIGCEDGDKYVQIVSAGGFFNGWGIIVGESTFNPTEKEEIVLYKWRNGVYGFYI